jgi:hypothetical protein
MGLNTMQNHVMSKVGENGRQAARITASTVSIEWNQAKVAATLLFSIPGNIMSFSTGQLLVFIFFQPGNFYNLSVSMSLVRSSLI